MTAKQVYPLEILVISLESDSHRRSQLRERFSRRFEQFQFISGVDLRDAPAGTRKTVPSACPRLARNPLSLAETGCTLSHLQALAHAERSQARSVLILEDDVIGDDDAIDAIAEVTARLPLHHFLLGGGQEGLRRTGYLYGEPRQGHFRLPGLVRRFAARACCYAVSPSMATVIRNRQKRCLQRADNWRVLLQGERNVYFAPKLLHPLDLSQSHLEADRDRARRKALWDIARADGFGYTIMSQILKAILPLLARAKGWRRIEIGRADPALNP